MKKYFSVITLLLLLASVALPLTSQAQCNNKDTKKRAKALEKEDWKPCPTCPSLATMFANSCEKENILSENGSSRYLYDEGNSRGPTMNAAKLKATNSAKFSIAGQITNEIKAKIEQYVANDEIEQVALDEMKAKIENWVITALPNVQPVIRMYRELEDGRFEYQVGLVYDREAVEEQVKAQAKMELKEKLREETKNMFNSDDFVDKTLGKG